MDTLKEMYNCQAIKDAGVINYWGAEFEFPSCPAFNRGVRKCADRGMYCFTPQSSHYNERVCWWMKNVRNFDIKPEWILSTLGTMYAIATLAMAWEKNGTGTLVMMTPDYARYKQIADRMDMKSILIPMLIRDGRYYPDFDGIEQAFMQAKDDMIFVFSNPSNPTGRAYTAEELKRLDGLSRKYRVPVASDEIFSEVTPFGIRPVPYLEAAEDDSLAMAVTSLGKCMSLTGVNHSNVLIKNPDFREIYAKMRLVKHAGSVDPMLYHGLVEAYSEEGADFVRTLSEVIHDNIVKFQENLPKLIPGCKVFQPDAGYLLWVDYSGVGFSEDDMLHFLNDEALFQGDPGDDYFVSRYYYRYNMAVPCHEVDRTLEFIEKAAKKRGLIR